MGTKSQACPKLPPSNVIIFDEQNDLSFSHEEVKGVVTTVLTHYHVKTDEVVLHFVDTKTICTLHEEYFSDPSVTDCITFPIDGPEPQTSPSILGEAFICPKTGIAYNPSSPYEELTLYIVHCLLHLIGYDDIEPEDEKVMREQERICLDLLKKEKKILTNGAATYT
ncbi:MAG: rRNA maturation RNase YbeY [Chlamydiae bacterium]|nr:rRNA maturation RNase YbeY [Chlamydiota bacterium]